MHVCHNYYCVRDETQVYIWQHSMYITLPACFSCCAMYTINVLPFTKVKISVGHSPM